MEICSLAHTGFDELAAAFGAAFAGYEVRITADELRRMLRRRGFDPALSFAAFDSGGRIAGFTLNGVGTFGGGNAHTGVRTAYDTGTGTLPEWRGRGLAGRVFEASLPHLRAAGVERYLLEVLQHNTAAVGLYRRLGFEVSREFNYFRAAAKDVCGRVQAEAGGRTVTGRGGGEGRDGKLQIEAGGGMNKRRSAGGPEARTEARGGLSFQPSAGRSFGLRAASDSGDFRLRATSDSGDFGLRAANDSDDVGRSDCVADGGGLRAASDSDDVRLRATSDSDGGEFDICRVELSTVREAAQGFWDFAPSWQNGFEAVERAADDFVILGAYDAGCDQSGNSPGSAKLFGYVIFEPAAGDITQIAVARTHRRRGIGSALLAEALRRNTSPTIKCVNTEAGRDEALAKLLKTHNIHPAGKQFEMIKQL